MRYEDRRDMKDGSIGTVLITYGTPENAALAANIDRLVRILIATRAPVRLITYCDPSLVETLDDDMIDQLPEHRVSWVKFFFGQMDLARALLRSGRAESADTLFFAFGSDLSLVPVLLGRLNGYRIIMRSDGRPTTLISRYFPGSSRLKLLGFRLIEAIVYRSTHLLLTESAFMIDDNEFTRYRPMVAPLPVAVDGLDEVTPFDVRPYDLVVAGRHSEQKGFDQLIEALPHLHHAHPSLKTLIIGDGPLRTAMKDRIHSEDLDGHVTFAGWVPREELYRSLMNSRMLLLPSRWEGLPNIVLEAMASGTAVVATGVGGIPGIISDGDTGFLIQACTSDAICAAVERALADPALALIADRGRRVVERNHSFEQVLGQYAAIFVELERRAASG